MTITREMVDSLLAEPTWYRLRIPPEKLELTHYDRVREWENLAVDLIAEYADRYWRRHRNFWDHDCMKAVPLDGDNSNYVKSYTLSIDAKEHELIREIEELAASHCRTRRVCDSEHELIREIEELAEQVRKGDYNCGVNRHNVQLSLLAPKFHAMFPCCTPRTMRTYRSRQFP